MRCILASEPDITVRSAADATALSKALRDEIPDILLVDFFVLENYLPVVQNKTKVLLLDTGCNEQQINHALIIKNVTGIIDMNTDMSLLRKAIAAVKNGQVWLRRDIIKHLISQLSDLVKVSALDGSEMSVFRMLGEGLDDVVIAKKLGTKEKKVKDQIETLKKISHAQNRWELIDLSRHFSEFDALTH
jgi:DNA-binding NarL/FixJ family response regulator